MGSRTKNAPLRKRMARPISGAEIQRWARHPTIRIPCGRAVAALLQQKSALEHAADRAFSERLTEMAKWLTEQPADATRQALCEGLVNGEWLPPADEQAEGGPAPAPADALPPEPAQAGPVAPAPFAAPLEAT